MTNKYFFLITCCVCLFYSCDVFDEERNVNNEVTHDTVALIISIDKPIDTAYLYTTYNPHDVRVVETSGENSRCNGNPVRVSGDLNINLAGTYHLNYDVEDNHGNRAATVTRTVHVVENKSAFLNGLYDAVCSCTLISKAAQTQTLANLSYRAEITSEPSPRSFKLISLFVGKDHVALSTALQDTLFDAQFFNPDYHMRSGGTGTIAASKNSFTIETTAYHFSGDIYRCKNVFVKKLIELRND